MTSRLLFSRHTRHLRIVASLLLIGALGAFVLRHNVVPEAFGDEGPCRPAALIAICLFMCWRRGVVADAECVRSLSRYLWIALIVAVSLEMLERVHMAYESGAEWHVLSVLLSERLRFSFWIVQVMIGALVPFVLLLVAMRSCGNQALARTLSGLASVLILVQVFAMR